jgi:hypothetical protein
VGSSRETDGLRVGNRRARKDTRRAGSCAVDDPQGSITGGQVDRDPVRAVRVLRPADWVDPGERLVIGIQSPHRPGSDRQATRVPTDRKARLQAHTPARRPGDGRVAAPRADRPPGSISPRPPAPPASTPAPPASSPSITAPAKTTPPPSRIARADRAPRRRRRATSQTDGDGAGRGARVRRRRRRRPRNTRGASSRDPRVRHRPRRERRTARLGPRPPQPSPSTRHGEQPPHSHRSCLTEPRVLPHTIAPALGTPPTAIEMALTAPGVGRSLAKRAVRPSPQARRSATAIGHDRSQLGRSAP